MNHIEQAISLLEQISRNTASSDDIRIAVIATIAAIAGAVIGAAGAYFAARLQANTQRRVTADELRVNTITHQRLEWLRSLRDAMTDLLAEFELLYSLLKRPDTKQSNLDPLFDSTLRESNTAVFMLNPEKTDQKQVIQSIYEFQAFLQKCGQQKTLGTANINDDAFRSTKEKLINGMWAIGKTTWGKVKKLE